MITHLSTKMPYVQSISSREGQIWYQCQCQTAAWLSGSTLVSIHKVTLLKSYWLVLGWVTICGWVNHLGL